MGRFIGDSVDYVLNQLIEATLAKDPRAAREALPRARRAASSPVAAARRRAPLAGDSRAGLYTGLVIVGAIGSGKTSACLYPYVEQLLAFRAHDPRRKVAALVLEVKGDFCQEVREILARHGRATDYVEVSLDSKYRYNPLHNDLNAYALAYGDCDADDQSLRPPGGAVRPAARSPAKRNRDVRSRSPVCEAGGRRTPTARLPPVTDIGKR